MVELAHLTGDRSADMKDERRRAQMAAARQVLDRSTMMLLTASKVSHVGELGMLCDETGLSRLCGRTDNIDVDNSLRIWVSLFS